MVVVYNGLVATAATLLPLTSAVKMLARRVSPVDLCQENPINKRLSRAARLGLLTDVSLGYCHVTVRTLFKTRSSTSRALPCRCLLGTSVRRVLRSGRYPVDCLLVNFGGAGVGNREAVVTLVACALLGLEAVPNLLVGFSFFAGVGYAPFLLGTVIGLAVGVLLGTVLLSQGSVSVPSGQEKGATRGALVGLAVGVVPVVLLSAPVVGMLAFCSLIGLAVGRTFDRSPIHRRP